MPGRDGQHGFGQISAYGPIPFSNEGNCCQSLMVASESPLDDVAPNRTENNPIDFADLIVFGWSSIMMHFEGVVSPATFSAYAKASGLGLQ